MKTVYCANCGQQLNIMRKALPKHAMIIDVVEYHVCKEGPIEFDPKPIDIPTFKVTEDKNKFVQKLNELSPNIGGVSTAHLRDRRFDTDKEVETTAPNSVLSMIDSMKGAVPERSLDDPRLEE